MLKKVHNVVEYSAPTEKTKRFFLFLFSAFLCALCGEFFRFFCPPPWLGRVINLEPELSQLFNKV